MTNIFVILNDVLHNQQIRINFNNITGYGVRRNPLTNEEYCAVFVNHPELSVIHVDESPEEIDQMLGECYVTIKRS